MSFQGYTMPPPSGGLDLITPIDNMEPTSALELQNIFPGAGAPTVRLGYQQFCDLGVTSPIQFMHEFPKQDGTAELIAAQGTKIYSISSTGVKTDVSKVGGYSSGKWNKEMFGNSQYGYYMYLANSYGDAPQVYKGGGVAAANINATCRGGSVAITELCNVAAYRTRLYFVQRNTMTMWYDKTAGAVMTTAASTLDSYDFSGIFRRGGYLLFTGSYTNQSGVTSQDYFMAVSSEGEIVMYSGSSPDATASDAGGAWNLVAHFIIGKPLGQKAFIRINQDIWIITQQGIVPVSALFQTDPEQALTVVSYKINPLISQYATQVALSEMWTGFFYPAGRRVYIILPDSTSTATLLVYSIDSKSWTQFQLYTSEHSIAACKYNNLPFYGSNRGVVYQGETGYADNVVSGSAGEAITFAGRSAFSFYGSRGNYKAFKDIRPIIKAKRGLTLQLGLDTDFKRQSILTNVTSPVSIFTAWGVRWGVGAGTINPYTGLPLTAYYQPWSGDVEYIFDRYAVAGQGHCAAIRFGGSIKNSPCQFIGFEIRYDLGGQV
jgi:hypothetical protein